MARGGPDDGDVIELQIGMTMIGRGPLNDIVVEEPGVSRQHTGILVDGQGCWIADLGSRNGTFVNDNQVGAEPRRLRHLDRVELGGIEIPIHWVVRILPETAPMKLSPSGDSTS